MKDWEINFKPNGVSIKVNKTRSLRDPDTGEVVDVPLGAHRCAVGVEDFETLQLFTDYVQRLMGGQYSKEIAAIASESVIMKDGITAAELAKVDAEDRLATTMDSLGASETALATANGTVQARTWEVRELKAVHRDTLREREVALEAMNAIAKARLDLNSELTKENLDLKTRVSDLEAELANVGKEAVETKENEE